MDIHKKLLVELSDDLAAGAVSSRELTEFFLDRINVHASLNAFISVTPERALACGDAADRLIKKGEAGPLTGIPLAHKDLFCTEGVKTSCGSRMLDTFIPPYDATVVSRLRQAGCVSLGKTNMDEFAMGSSNETSWYGCVKNPWDSHKVPGGSSGGSAAVVSAGLAAAATGTDTGGSIRQPASLCGITGLKPTYGRVSRYGMVAFSSSLDQAGPMAKSAHDCALLLNAMAGFDDRDSTSINRTVDDYTAQLERPLHGMKIGLPKEYFDEGLDADVAVVIESAIQDFKRLGVTFKSVSLPNQHLAVPVYYVLSPAECASNLSRFDGVRFGHRCDDPCDLSDLYKRSRSEGFGEEVKCRMMTGTYVLSAGYYEAYYLKAQQLRHLISDDFKAALASVDFILGPTSPSIAFSLSAKQDDPVAMYLNDIYTIGASLAGLPSISIPCGFSNLMPVGLQLIGRPFDESLILNAAHHFQHQTDWHLRVPSLDMTRGLN